VIGSLLPALVGGCAAFTGYPSNYQNTAAVISADEPYLNAGVRTIGDNPDDTARNGFTRQQYRDAVVFRRLEVIDLNYYDFESKLTGQYNALDVGADLVVLILNGLGATTGAAATKAALAAASAGVVGAKNVVNTDLFYQKTLPALVAQMRASRLTVLATIVKGLQTPVSSYTLNEALLDVSNYYVAGTLPGAIAQVTTQAGAQAAKASADVAFTRDSVFLQSIGQRTSLETQVSNLTNAQALSVYKAMQQYVSTRSATVQTLLKTADPNNLAATNGASAKSLLKYWVALDTPDSTLASHWATAIKAATAAN
jgi:hypothetical protein